MTRLYFPSKNSVFRIVILFLDNSSKTNFICSYSESGSRLSFLKGGLKVVKWMLRTWLLNLGFLHVVSDELIKHCKRERSGACV